MKYPALIMITCLALCGCAVYTTPKEINQQRRADIENAYNTGHLDESEYERQQWEANNPDHTDPETLGEIIWNEGE